MQSIGFYRYPFIMGPRKYFRDPPKHKN
ncbi:hypothetical protein Pint_26307 [Pistacia integerrima]|uniref:Uncharacterized protein n=5 Tax=Pistacia TaxID=55512 RepID=A0ACC0YGR0_9ROSI|nr:hypothetical protein Pint_26307 [Pistacia integerrima]